MKIKAIKVENFKGIESAHVEPGERALVLVAGRNAQGKSSLLDGIAATLGGKRLLPERPIRDGAEKAELTVELDDGMVVTRTITQKTDRLEVKTAQGFKVGSPQAALDRLYGAIAFDPLQFEAADDKSQREMLLRAMGIGPELDKLEFERSEAYATRRDINRDLKRVRTEADAITVPELTLQRMDATAIRAEITNAGVVRAQRAERQVEVVRCRNAIDAIEKLVGGTREVRDSLQRQIEELTQRAKAAQLRLVELDVEKASALNALDLAELEFDTSAEPPDVSALERRLADCEAHNRAIDAAARDAAAKDAKLAEARKLEAQSKAQDEKLKAIEQQKAAVLQKVRLPIPGLSIAEDVLDESGKVLQRGGVLLGGVPFRQAASSQRLKASFAIVAALCPELRVALCRHGERLDADSLGELAEFAETADMQLFVERVGTSDAGAIVIEAGRVEVQP